MNFSPPAAGKPFAKQSGAAAFYKIVTRLYFPKMQTGQTIKKACPALFFE